MNICYREGSSNRLKQYSLEDVIEKVKHSDDIVKAAYIRSEIAARNNVIKSVVIPLARLTFSISLDGQLGELCDINYLVKTSACGLLKGEITTKVWNDTLDRLNASGNKYGYIEVDLVVGSADRYREIAHKLSIEARKKLGLKNADRENNLVKLCMLNETENSKDGGLINISDCILDDNSLDKLYDAVDTYVINTNYLEMEILYLERAYGSKYVIKNIASASYSVEFNKLTSLVCLGGNHKVLSCYNPKIEYSNILERTCGICVEDRSTIGSNVYLEGVVLGANSLLQQV